MRRGHGIEEEEGLVTLSERANLLDGPLRQFRNDVAEVPSGRDRIALEAPRHHHSLRGVVHVALGRRGRDGLVLDERKRRHVGQIDAEVVVEASGGRTAADRFREIPFERLLAVAHLGHAALLGAGPLPAEMPLPDQGCRVAVVAQDAGQRGAARGDQGRLVGGKHPLLKPRAPGVAACQQAVSRRRADCGRAVGIGEAHPFCHQLVQIGRRDLVIGIVGLNVADAEIVG